MTKLMTAVTMAVLLAGTATAQTTGGNAQGAQASPAASAGGKATTHKRVVTRHTTHRTTRTTGPSLTGGAGTMANSQ